MLPPRPFISGSLSTLPKFRLSAHATQRAVDRGLSVVLVSADGSTRVLRPDLAAR
jgi:hypothetical protein